MIIVLLFLLYSCKKIRMKEPIEYFFGKHGIVLKDIQQIVCGEKYVAVVKKDGKIGVCATLDNYVNIDINDLRLPDLKNIQHRIVINAYYNAIFNYENNYDRNIDIFDEIDFKNYSNIVMIGYFKSLTEKFNNEMIPLTIFDKEKSDSRLTNMSEQLKVVSQADCLILTSTAVFNNTFLDLVNATNEKCHIFTLGPSTIMSKEMFLYRNIRLLFGSLFDLNDQRVLEIIKSGGGTKNFMPYMKKVFLQSY